MHDSSLNMPISDAKTYHGYADLKKHQQLGQDFDVIVSPQSESRIAVIAPHGGKIERGTSNIARQIAKHDFNLYLFEGKKPSNNYETLHLTSHRFDEPQCLRLISKLPIVVAIHGCNGKEEKIYLGGRDDKTKVKLAEAFEEMKLNVQLENHAYPGTHRSNICNRGLTKKGVQIELTDSLRETAAEAKVISAIRKVLLELEN